MHRDQVVHGGEAYAPNSEPMMNEPRRGKLQTMPIKTHGKMQDKAHGKTRGKSASQDLIGDVRVSRISDTLLFVDGFFSSHRYRSQEPMIKCSHSAICAMRSKKSLPWIKPIRSRSRSLRPTQTPTVSASARPNNNRTAQEEIIMQKQTSRLAGRA
ncbi:MAG: hypothetical protein ACN6PB_26835 [Achromobacter kerstersii]|uniref:hypothetical protein n=1 Tax=Achromobacter kerstersii TaxID=1353890 RepID=UPI003D0749BF